MRAPTQLVRGFFSAGFVLALILGSAPAVWAQDAPEEASARTFQEACPEGISMVDEAPELIGGVESFQARADTSEAVQQARRAGASGKAFVQFWVDKSGAVVEPSCLRSPSDASCEAALQVVRSSKYRPARSGGKPVCTRMSLPVVF